MLFIKTSIDGAFIIENNNIEDSRGYFSRVWCYKEFIDAGIKFIPVQCNTSYNKEAGTFRGLHYQADPKGEAKLVRCTKGRIFDVAVDIRKDSKTFGESVGVELSDKNMKMLFVPEGCAHGYLTLEDDSEVFYLVSEYYDPELSFGLRWNDPFVKIDWPETKIKVISPKDQSWEDFKI